MFLFSIVPRFGISVVRSVQDRRLRSSRPETPPWTRDSGPCTPGDSGQDRRLRPSDHGDSGLVTADNKIFGSSFLFTFFLDICVLISMLSIYLFTGKAPRTKSAAPVHGSAPRLKKRRSGDCEFDEEQQCYVPESVRQQKARAAKREAAEQAKFLQAQMERDAMFDELDTLTGLSKEDFRDRKSVV